MLSTTIIEKNNKLSPLVFAMQAILAGGATLSSLHVAGAETTRVSVSSAGIQGNDGSSATAISADGRFVVFESFASNLVAGDTNGRPDIFVRDRQTKQTMRVSVSSAGVQGNYASYSPAISADGRFVAFESGAGNLVAGDTNASRDIFVRDRQTNQTTRVSISSAGVQGNHNSYRPAISADGRIVAFMSRANNLVAGDTNVGRDIFVRDRLTNQTTRVSVSSAGAQGNGFYGSYHPAISANGRFVAFASLAGNLVGGDTNGKSDIFVRDRQTSQTTRVSVSSAGTQSNNYSYQPTISADGRFVAFESSANNLVTGDTNASPDIFVRDRHASQTTRASVSSAGVQGNLSSETTPAVSADGRFVAFKSWATNLVTGDTNGKFDIFVRDRQANQTTRVSVTSAGGEGDDNSYRPTISADGRFLAFESGARNLVANDSNLRRDTFVHDRLLNPAATADLTVTQTVSANPVPISSTFSFTATVKNLGSSNVSGVTLTNIAPTHNRVSPPQTLIPNQGTCYRGPISVCRLGIINAGQQATVQIGYTALGVGPVTNRVSVNAIPKESTPSNNTVITSTTISP